MTDTPEQSRKCSNCMWMHRSPGLSDDEGECRAGPPERVEYARGHAWPWTYSDAWCGSFRMKEPGQ
jgi:hypothetical protein